MRSTLKACILGVVIAVFAIPAATADMGRVYVSTRNATVSETAQRAIILHNGKDEILILATQLQSTARTPIIRFIPFPSEPKVRLARKDIFARLQSLIAKYHLQYVYAFHSKGPAQPPRTQGVEIRLATRLGAHDITVIKVHDVAAFRDWVNAYFRQHRMPWHASYPGVEAIVADYVARGIDYFVLDAVDVGTDSRLVEPLAYSFKSPSLYYPLKTTNSFGGKGEIELFIVSPTTLCLPGSGIMPTDPDRMASPSGGSLGLCMGLDAKASTSAQLVPEEKDLEALDPRAATFFDHRPVFIQAVRYQGVYHFKDDIVVPMPAGVPRAIDVSDVAFEGGGPFWRHLGEDKAVCHKLPDRGPCKGVFEAYYFDPKSHSCRMFIWGGCQGSVPFHTLNECQQECSVAPSK